MKSVASKPSGFGGIVTFSRRVFTSCGVPPTRSRTASTTVESRPLPLLSELERSHFVLCCSLAVSLLVPNVMLVDLARTGAAVVCGGAVFKIAKRFASLR